MPTLLLTGANRGIGLEFARQFSAEGWEVIAGCRAPETATALAAMPGKITVERLDVNDAHAVEALAAKHKGHAIDLLINNAGISGSREPALSMGDPSQYLKVLQTNSVAPMKTTLAFLPHLQLARNSKVVTVSSRLGSMTYSTGGLYAYRASKAAVNAAMHALALDLKPKEITCVVVHPGWVRTDMGGSGADITVEQSVTGLRRVIGALTLADSGKFFNYSGEELPW